MRVLAFRVIGAAIETLPRLRQTSAPDKREHFLRVFLLLDDKPRFEIRLALAVASGIEAHDKADKLMVIAAHREDGLPAVFPHFRNRRRRNPTREPLELPMHVEQKCIADPAGSFCVHGKSEGEWRGK